MNTEITDITNYIDARSSSMRPCPSRVSVLTLASVASLMLPCLALVLGRSLPGWMWMWVIAGALFVAAKWITIFRFRRRGQSAVAKRVLAYLFLWPGMDVFAFCGSDRPLPPGSHEWIVAVAKTVLGVAVLWLGVPLIGVTYPLISGWLGMLGIVSLLHFGLFHILSVLLRTLGINARPLMQSPATATSLSRFWGGAWNTAFTDLVHDNLFKPLTRLVGPRAALLLVFLTSGLLHELVISLPARGGYGLPTLYFVLQGLGLLFERSSPGRELGLGSGWKGWCFVVLVAGVPAFWLFHPIFIHNVILPMLHAIGAN